jgi:hypothetical protein
MTPSLMLRRDQLERRYRSTFSSLYQQLDLLSSNDQVVTNCVQQQQQLVQQQFPSPAASLNKSAQMPLLPLCSLRDESDSPPVEPLPPTTEAQQRSILRSTL